MDKISSATAAAKRAGLQINTEFQGDLFCCVSVGSDINRTIDLNDANANVKLESLLQHIYAATPAEQAMQGSSLTPKKTANALYLLQELMALSIDAHSYLVDINVTVSGHINGVMIMIVTDCTAQMYLDGKQPEPVVHVNFNLSSDKAEQFIGAAIDTANDLIAERKTLTLDKDAA